MCGIFGYIGKEENGASTILEGLKLLEYRGYDSWGVAVKINKRLVVEKHIGKIGNAYTSLPKSNFGIGHTRWATHGGVTIANAHPHLDCTKQIAVVHNGIVENFTELKEDLIKKGHVFTSETDTEIVAHLVEEFLKKEGFASAVRDSFNLLKGLNAVVIAYAPSTEIIAAKTGSPLVIGKTKTEFIISSDVPALLKHTNEILFLKDNEMIILGKHIQLLRLPHGKKITPQFEKVSWKFDQVTKGTFEHFMLKEIYEQPKVIRNIVKHYDEQIIRLSNTIKKAQGTFLIGAGTAFHACMAGMYLFSKVAHEHVNTTVASEFTYLEDFLTKKSLIIALSQSGETIDVIESLNRAREKESKIIAITNALGSTIYRFADEKILLGAGPEKAVASTKSYIAKLAVMVLLAFSIARKTSEGKKQLMDAADEVERLLGENVVKTIKKIARFLGKTDHIYTIGRGVSYPTALEAALKIKEVSYIHTEGLAGGELKHGTIALITKGTPCIVFAPNDETYQSIISNAIEIKSRGGEIIGIGFRNEPVYDHWIEVKDIAQGTILANIIPPQLLAYFLAVEKGFDPDKPRNLAKSVTVK